MEKKRIEQLFVGLGEIVDVGAKPAGVSKSGKSYPPKIFVEFRTEDDRWMMLDFKVGNEFDDKKLKKFLDFFKLTEKKQIVTTKGKRLAIFVAPGEWQGKVFWNVKDFFDPKYLKNPSESAFDDVLGDLDNLNSLVSGKTGTDDIPF